MFTLGSDKDHRNIAFAWCEWTLKLQYEIGQKDSYNLTKKKKTDKQYQKIKKNTQTRIFLHILTVIFVLFSFLNGTLQIAAFRQVTSNFSSTLTFSGCSIPIFSFNKNSLREDSVGNIYTLYWLRGKVFATIMGGDEFGFIIFLLVHAFINSSRLPM